MRGKRTIRIYGRMWSGLIPAHAGKTLYRRAGSCRGWAHPRACGENIHVCQGSGVFRGSSPRMRGKHGPLRSGDMVEGLIPAHAGKTVVALSSRLQRWAHPRACGENRISANFFLPMAGSSPRMRGKRRPLPRRERRDRLIPAHAGKTSRASSKSWPASAHPRACGENSTRISMYAKTSGSSPRMRGKHEAPVEEAPAEGLIPAHAGKTAAQSAAGWIQRAHPRACGENRKSLYDLGLARGSSPRMRGKP